MALMTKAKGSSVFTETIFENRFKHVGELHRMGAKITTDGRVAVVEGVKKLYGARVESTDLRGGAALVVAALSAEGTSVIENISHIERGYENIEKALSSLGAKITRQQ
ncbi:MAG: UDP-N-acetylglucosamine 1-carboxyvinyltransferase, partial [Clostridia bacterium]|nr:UDP-N-acetylglucosamine 1-carboxyvinyltransferase [Clostridia bacterium]